MFVMHRNDFASISVAFPRPAKSSNVPAHKIVKNHSLLAIASPPFFAAVAATRGGSLAFLDLDDCPRNDVAYAQLHVDSFISWRAWMSATPCVRQRTQCSALSLVRTTGT